GTTAATPLSLATADASFESLNGLSNLLRTSRKRPLSLLWPGPLLSGMSWLLRNRGMISLCQAGSSEMKPTPLAAYYTS
ncbi:hypothetical protein COCCADRAFT_108515, partial [Bipolaris zeicola 26-R-13]